MTLKIIGDMKAMHFYNHKDPPFDMKHQLMSADPLPVIKIDLKYTIDKITESYEKING